MFTQFIRRTLIASSLVLGSAVALAPAALADTLTASGTVATSASVATTATAAATALNLGGTGTDLTEQIVKVGDVALSTNNTTGLTLTVASGNSGKLSNGTVASDIAYKVTTVADAGVAPGTAAFTTASGTSYTYTNSAQSDARDLYIAYDPAALQDPGTYSGTMTLTVADN